MALKTGFKTEFLVAQITWIRFLMVLSMSAESSDQSDKITNQDLLESLTYNSCISQKHDRNPHI
jgi:hypothetical protein